MTAPDDAVVCNSANETAEVASDPQAPEADLHQQLDTLRRQLQQAHKLSTLGALTSSITHEFNNVLTTIINYCNLGLRQRDDPSRDKAFDRIRQAGQRAARLTSGILAYARMRPDQREGCDVVPLVEDVLMLLERDLAKHQIRVFTHFEGNPRITANANQIQQVLMNLVINARQAMPEGGRLLVSTTDSATLGIVEISVSDSGMGIPPDKLRHIFDPFFTTKTGPDSSGKGGTGLGLSFCRDIIEAHQGKIRVESALGQGTTFTLKLPASEIRVG